MMRHIERRTTVSTIQPNLTNEQRSDSTNSDKYEQYQINGEVFILTDNISGTGGWTHICNRHLRETGNPDDLKFPDGTTEQEVEELIQKTIEHGKWYPETDPPEGDRPERKKRVYLWDSRADETAKRRCIRQMCVVTTNGNSSQHSIITAYPRYGENISQRNPTRGDERALDDGNRIEAITASIAQRTEAILADIKKIDQDIIDHQNAQLTTDQEFLSTLSSSQTRLASELQTAKRERKRAEYEQKKSRVSADSKLYAVVENDVSGASSRIKTAEQSISGLRNAIAEKDTELQANAAADDRLSTTQPDPPNQQRIESGIASPQQISSAENNKISRNIQKITSNLRNINRRIDDFDKRRSNETKKVDEMESIFVLGGTNTLHEDRESFLKLQTVFENMDSEQTRLSHDLTEAVTQTKSMADRAFPGRHTNLDTDQLAVSADSTVNDNIKNTLGQIQNTEQNISQTVSENEEIANRLIDIYGTVDFINEMIEEYNRTNNRSEDENKREIRELMTEITLLRKSTAEMSREILEAKRSLDRLSDRDIRRGNLHGPFTSLLSKFQQASDSLGQVLPPAEISQQIVHERSLYLKDGNFARIQTRLCTQIMDNLTRSKLDLDTSGRQIEERLARISSGMKEQGR